MVNLFEYNIVKDTIDKKLGYNWDTTTDKVEREN